MLIFFETKIYGAKKPNVNIKEKNMINFTLVVGFFIVIFFKPLISIDNNHRSLIIYKKKV